MSVQVPAGFKDVFNQMSAHVVFSIYSSCVFDEAVCGLPAYMSFCVTDCNSNVVVCVFNFGSWLLGNLLKLEDLMVHRQSTFSYFCKQLALMFKLIFFIFADKCFDR